MKLQVTHHTKYSYTPAVETAQHIACLRPCETTNQSLLAYSLLIDPTPQEQKEIKDVFNNTQTYFTLQSPHETLDVISNCTVQTEPPKDFESQVAWERVRDLFKFKAGNVFDPANEFIFPSPHIKRHEDFINYARSSFTPARPLLDAARDLMKRIYSDFTYESNSTQINTPALQALAERKGVCQDFAHIMIACMRSLGLPARYISGYLLTHPAPGKERLIGSDASHAWISIYIPDLPNAEQGQGWWDLDPTNNNDGWGSPGEDYVRVAYGRDFSDISPIRGLIHGGAHHTLSVAVTVQPIEESN
jgi:transglutaminase-like putative cysteine protease